MSAPRRHPARRGEQGVVLIWAIIAIAVMAVIAVSISMLSKGTIERSKSKSERALTYPHVQSAVTKLGVALQADLASDRDNYALSTGDLATLGPSGAANVATGTGIPAQFRSTGGVYRHGTGDTFVYVGGLPVAAYHESASLSAAQCGSLGIPSADCATGLHGFWQIYRVELPDVTNDTTVGQVVYYVRTWVGPASGAYGSDATVVRVATRPGRFADYQLISDGTIIFRDGAKINGAVHSNGFDTDDPATGGVNTPYAIKTAPGVTCGADGSLTSASKTIDTAAGAGCPQQESTNRYITFLRVQTQLDEIVADVAQPDVFVFPQMDNPSLEPLEHAYRVRLSGSQFQVKPPGGGWSTYNAGSGAGAALFQDDVVIEGGNLTTRFTFAASRPNEGAASIYIEGNVNAGVTAPGKTLGLIAQGNVVLRMIGTAGACNVTTVRAAIVAAAGGLTIPPEYATQQIQTGQPRCGTPLLIDGSIAAHRPPLLYWKWVDGSWTGYDDRKYVWDKRLINATPPYFPLTGNWQATSIREANIDCYAGGRKLDAKCA